MNGGDMWWDLVGTAKYEIPKIPDGSNEARKHSLFAGSIWIGGIENGNVIAAAQTYRGPETDFWPGPLDTNSASIKKDDCNYWDRVFKVTRDEVDQFLEDYEENGSRANVPKGIMEWPGNGRNGVHEDKFMAPYVDVGGGPEYDPMAGDYPDIKGDQAIWYVYNDVGNLKTETGSPNVGLELRTMAFAFATNDEVNNMTFYETTVYNRGQKQLDKTYFGQWVDADLGFYNDDYVGCDTIRGLGICYNGDNFDDGITGYGANPPSVGVDFFEGPKADLEMIFGSGLGDGIDNDGDGQTDEFDSTFFDELRAMGYEDMPAIYEGDGIDNNRNGLVDEPLEDITMSKFIYYNNDLTVNGNVRSGQVNDYYGYLIGRWKNGDYLQYGGNGLVGTNGRRANFMFPSDPRDQNGWSEVTENNEPKDRRFIQSAGPFTLKPGAVNKVTIGVVWAQASQGGNTGSYDLLLLADDKAQKLFNNGFELLDGPDAPEVAVVELDREVLLMLDREDYMETESYEETQFGVNKEEVTYRFQGYQLFQLANAQVAPDQLLNPDFAREVWQVDLADKVSRLVNREFDPSVDDYIPTIMVDGNDEGIFHTIRLTDDAFASGNSKLINHKTYHYILVAYASVDAENTSEDIQYLAGRRIQKFSVVPSKTRMLFDGVDLNSHYGDGPEITRMEGLGNGGIDLKLTEETINEILKNGVDHTPTYQRAHGPVEVKVIDPLKVPVADFELRFIDSAILNTRGERLLSTLTEEQAEVARRNERVQLLTDEAAKLSAALEEIASQINARRKQKENWLLALEADTTDAADSAYLLRAIQASEFEIGELQKDSSQTVNNYSKELNKLRKQERALESGELALKKRQEQADGVIWELTKINTDGTREIVRAEKGLYENNEMVIEEWGLSITAGPEFGPGEDENDASNGLLSVELEFQESAIEWLTAMPHFDNNSEIAPSIFDWVRGGNFFADGGTSNPAFHDAVYGSRESEVPEVGILDPNWIYKEGGKPLIAPYMLTSRSTEFNGIPTYGLCQAPGYGRECQNFLDLPGIDLVFTADRSKWSRVLVVEMGEDASLNQGGTEKFHVRNHASLELLPDANGNPVYSNSSKGFSWFPGYAINVETGERLNIIIGENSALKTATGKDMLWNPSDRLLNSDIPIQYPGGAVIGGMHYIYVMGAQSRFNIDAENDLSRYDGCKNYYRFLAKDGKDYSRLNFNDVWSDCMWVMPAMMNEGYSLKSWSDGLIPVETSLRVRVNRAYQTYALQGDNSPSENMPFFTFGTAEIAPTVSTEIGKEALAEVRVVPNPYYAQSTYEKTQLENHVKLTNLPKECAIRIYTVNGQLVKTFFKSETDATHNRDLTWDLKNEADVPIASGAYVIHIDAGELGSHIVKFMAVMKQVDLDTF